MANWTAHTYRNCTSVGDNRRMYEAQYNGFTLRVFRRHGWHAMVRDGNDETVAHRINITSMRDARATAENMADEYLCRSHWNTPSPEVVPC